MTSRIDTGAAIKVALWAVPVLFGFGAMYQSLAGSSAHVAEVAQDLEKHKDLRAHPVTEERINTILTEQRALREDVADQAVALGAICQATGASCR